MEAMNMKSKKKTALVVLAAVVVLLIAAAAFTIPSLFDGSRTTIYYTQIDNSKIEENDSRGGVVNFKGSLPYSYTLTSYDENGKEKEITFGTSERIAGGCVHFPGGRASARRDFPGPKCSMRNCRRLCRASMLHQRNKSFFRLKGIGYYPSLARKKDSTQFLLLHGTGPTILLELAG